MPVFIKKMQSKKINTIINPDGVLKLYVKIINIIIMSFYSYSLSILILFNISKTATTIIDIENITNNMWFQSKIIRINEYSSS